MRPGHDRTLPADAHDRERWQTWGTDSYAGRSWFAVPWLWSESWFYRRLLDAVGYFAPGPWQGVDLFRPSKLAELGSPATDEELAALDDLTGRPEHERARALLHGSLWGNRADLGFRLSAEGAEEKAAVPALVADDSERLWSLLAASGTGTLCLVADNAGRELVPDLLLIAHLLAHGRIGRAVLHIKPYPYYVSDATTADVLDAVRRLTGAGERPPSTGARCGPPSPTAGSSCARTRSPAPRCRTPTCRTTSARTSPTPPSPSSRATSTTVGSWATGTGPRPHRSPRSRPTFRGRSPPCAP
ncbi:hypothetical protein SHKM778_29400 [Streptomyces sp. KM77-8]|uniref:Damage-control phosphatase ARMT1-like metal-binding domain-containing protein n=1 Tax=Streptomyces haneummycinicus TaxID=3074435 RepID=A0AAT9HGE7_9ACTN